VFLKVFMSTCFTPTRSKKSQPKTEQSPPVNRKGKVTAVVAMAKYNRAQSHKSSKKATKEKQIWVLLDSGSDGDLLFHEKGTPKHFSYLTRQVPCSWHTWNGVFQTKGRGKLPIKFFEYSNSKEFLAEPDVFEHYRKVGKPLFDLIIGCNSMEKLGIVMDFNSLTAMVAYLRPLFLELPKKIIFSANFCPLSRPRVTPTS
jgi:hypothetical protein